MDSRQGVNIDDFNADQDGAQSSRLTSNEVGAVRDLLGNLPRWENVLNTLQRDQTLLTESVAAFANRVEARHYESDAQAARTQQLLDQVIEQMQQFANQSSATMMAHTEQFRAMRGEMDQLHSEVRSQRAEIAELRAKVATLPSLLAGAGAESTNDAKLYPEWDVLGNMPPGTPEYSSEELESRIAKSLRQKETPIFAGEDNEDIDVYVRNMILWYGGFGLFLRQPQVDVRVGQLMMNHTKDRAKAWLVREYTGEWRWSCVVKKLRQRFLTKSREEDEIGRLFDCTQGTRSLDQYIEEFIRLSRTEEVSVKFKMILFKKGLHSQELRNFLQTKQHATLEGLVDAARAMNPRENPADAGARKGSTSKSQGTQDTGKTRKPTPATPEKKSDLPRCTPTYCTEQGHTRDKCWKLHPELQPKWLKNKKNNAASTTSEPLNSSTDRLLEMMASLQADMAQLKADLN